MRVSVIVPCHNAEPYLRQTVTSVLAQTRPAEEIIILDDGSSDGSLAIARDLAAGAHGRLQVIATDLGSAARARNVGALAASGDALLFLDADDLLGPTALEALTGVLSRHPDAVAVCPWFRLEYDEGRWIERPPSCAPRRPGEDPLDAWLTGWYHPPCAVLWSREAYERAGRWDDYAFVNDDGDVMMRALVAGVALVGTDEGASYYRRQPANRASWSGFRCTRAGILDRARIIEKIAAQLLSRHQLAPHARALQAAMTRITADARSTQAELVAILQRQARRYRHRGRSKTLANRVVTRPPQTPRAPRRAERPLVSVIVPTHNRADVLPRATASVLCQTYGDFELLIVDDGSTDATPDAVAALRDSRVRYLRQPANRGVAAARNRGIRAASGDLIAFLDSDDEWTADKLAAQVDVLRSSPPAVGLVYSGVETVDAQGTSSVQRPEARGDVFREMLWRNVVHGGGSNVMLRREAIATAGFFDEDLPAVEDYEYWLRVARFFDVEFVGAPLVRYYDPPHRARRSRAIRANLEARWCMYRTYGPEMRAAGVAHMFLLHTVRWAVAYAGADARLVHGFLLQALLERPASRMTIATAAHTLLPASQRFKWVQRHAMV